MAGAGELAGEVGDVRLDAADAREVPVADEGYPQRSIR
jgi:hypothetical protein